MFSKYSDRSILQMINTVADLAILSILWALSSLPIITIGLANATLYHTVELVVVQGCGTIFATFIRSLKDNWRSALPLGMLLGTCCAATAAVAAVAYYSDGGVLLVQFLPCALAFLFLVTVQIYLFPLLGHFVLSSGQLAVMSLQLTLLHPLRSLFLLVLFLGAVASMLCYPPLVMLIPATYMLVASRIFAPLFARYIRIAPTHPASDMALPEGYIDNDF